MSINMLKDAQILKNYLRNNGITQGQLADKLGMTRQNLVFHLSKERFSLDFTERLRQVGIDLSVDKFDTTLKHNLSSGHTPTIPILSTDQGNVLLMSINAASYAAIEMLCRVVSNQENIPIEQVRAQANQLTHERQRLVEQVLDKLVSVVPSDNTKKTDSN